MVAPCGGDGCNPAPHHHPADTLQRHPHHPQYYVSAAHLPNAMLSLSKTTYLDGNCSSAVDEAGPRWVVYQVVFPALVGVGVMANLLNLVVLSRPAMRGVAYRYLNHLAVSDLLYLLFNVPFCLEDFVRVSVSGQAAGRSSAVYYAYVGVPLVNLFLTMSEYIVVWLSYDRCLAVCWPHKFSAKQRLRVVRERCGLSLALTMAVYCLSPLSQTYQCEGAVCCVIDSPYSHLGWFMGYELFREIYSRFLPALLVTGFNVAIVVTLRRLHRERGAEDVINESRQERERRLFVLLVAVTVLFYVTAFPSAMYKVLPGADPRLESVLRPHC
ncbi:hypothetical protein O3P69_020199 [Scylla paramamosain]|uniref:G-protein coupled receptors family 1 profile domain-containing protein n=1 Tax=Scylla paramamosain TaxID=85552 RepID=A0AAW0TK80_SCYPA